MLLNSMGGSENPTVSNHKFPVNLLPNAKYKCNLFVVRLLRLMTATIPIAELCRVQTPTCNLTFELESVALKHSLNECKSMRYHMIRTLVFFLLVMNVDSMIKNRIKFN